MIIRILTLALFLPMLFVVPDIEKESSTVCLEMFMHKNGKIYVMKSEVVLPSNYRELYQWGGKPRKKRVWIEIYVATKLGIKLKAIINGKIITARPESYDFSDSNKENFKGR
jgi:hypothetical protein